MAEQRNLTQENVKELKTIFKRMQEENPDVEYWFFPITQLRQQTVELPYYSQHRKLLESLFANLERAQKKYLRRLQRAC